MTTPSRAEWLSGPSREVRLAHSASPDAPVTSYAYGPRARATLGQDLAFLATRRPAGAFRFGGAGLVAFEDAHRRAPFPGETARTAFDLSLAWSFERLARALMGRGGAVEVATTLGVRSAFALEGTFEVDPYQPDDVPFGAGGWFLGLDGALRFHAGSRLFGTFRMGARGFTNAYPDLVGATEASDYVASLLREGAAWQSYTELGLRWWMSERLATVAWLYADAVLPHDDSAKGLLLLRAVWGVALPGARHELVPFLDAEVGRGQGLLVNRTEARLGGGVRVQGR